MASLKDDSEDRQAIVFALGPAGRHPRRRVAAVPPPARLGRRHAPAGRLDDSDPPVLRGGNRRGARRRRDDARLGRHDLLPPRNRSHLRPADRPPPDAAQPVPDPRRPRARADDQRLAARRGSSSTARSPAAARRSICGEPRRTSSSRRTSALTSGAHLLQVGFQVPDWSRRGFDDRSGFGGTYYFADLTSYARAGPYAFVQQSGNGNVVWLEKVLGLLRERRLADRSARDAVVRPAVRLVELLRRPRQPGAAVLVRVKPGGSEATVLRGGAGVFYDKIGPVPHRRRAELPAGRPAAARRHQPGVSRSVQSGGAAAEPPSIGAVRAGHPGAVDAAVQRRRRAPAREDETLSVMYYGSDSDAAAVARPQRAAAAVLRRAARSGVRRRPADRRLRAAARRLPAGHAARPGREAGSTARRSTR